MAIMQVQRITCCRYRFEIKDLLHIGINELTILFHSAVRIAHERVRSFLTRFPIAVSHPVTHVNLVQKQLAMEAGLGPLLDGLGIYGDIYLGATSVGRLSISILADPRTG